MDLEQLKQQNEQLQSQIADLTGSVTSLTAKNRELISERKGLNEKLSFVFDKVGVKSAEELDSIAETLAKARKSGGDEGKLSDKARQQFEAELRARDEKLGAMTKRLHSVLIDGELSRAIAEHDGIPELLEPIVRRLVRVAENGDKFSVEVLDDDGEPRLAAGKPVTVSDFVKALRGDEKYLGAFKASGANGSGSSSSGRRPPASGPKTSLEKIKSGLSNLQR